MKGVFIGVGVAVLVALRIWIHVIRRRRRVVRSTGEATPPTSRASPAEHRRTPSWLSSTTENAFGDVGIVAMREIKQRVRGRIFRVGTLIVLIGVAAAIIVPSIHKGSGLTNQPVGIVGGLSAGTRAYVHTTGTEDQDSVRFVLEPSVAAAKSDLRSGKTAFAIVDNERIVLNQPASSSSSPADAALVQSVAEYLGALKAFSIARLTPAQAATVLNTRSAPIETLEPHAKGKANAPSVVGLILLFVMLQQYNTWILIGVMQEKSSRVVEVLLAALRPLQLLGGKVLGIGLVALGQAALIVSFALVVGAAVGSDLLHGTAPLVLGCQLLWLVLGYAFYCWLYAAAGSTAERQDQVQTLALPLSLPALLGYIFAITVASSGNADLAFKVLAYLPPTAPFCMPVLVGLNLVTWWEFVASVLISVAGTAGMAIFAARIYRRAVLRTGGRPKFRELVSRTGTRRQQAPSAV